MRNRNNRRRNKKFITQEEDIIIIKAAPEALNEFEQALAVYNAWRIDYQEREQHGGHYKALEEVHNKFGEHMADEINQHITKDWIG